MLGSDFPISIESKYYKWRRAVTRVNTWTIRARIRLLDPQQQPPLRLFDFFPQRPPIAPVHHAGLFIRPSPALDRRLERHLACIEGRHLAWIQVAYKDHHRSARWKGGVERHGVGARRRLCSDSEGVATMGPSGVAFVTAQGVHKARKLPKQGLLRGGGLDQAVQHLLIAPAPIAAVNLALGLPKHVRLLQGLCATRLNHAVTPLFGESCEAGFEGSSAGIVIRECGVDAEGVANPECFQVGFEGVTDEGGSGASRGSGLGDGMGDERASGKRGKILWEVVDDGFSGWCDY